MKRVIILILMLHLWLISCSEMQQDAQKPLPIELDTRVVKIDHINTKDTSRILKGNGEYELARIDENADEPYNHIPFEDHTKVILSNNIITIERILLEDFMMYAAFTITDAKGIRKTFVVETPGFTGMHDFYD